MIYLSLFILALLLYKLIWTITNEIKRHITKESDRIIEEVTRMKNLQLKKESTED